MKQQDAETVQRNYDKIISKHVDIIENHAGSLIFGFGILAPSLVSSFHLDYINSQYAILPAAIGLLHFFLLLDAKDEANYRANGTVLKEE